MNKIEFVNNQEPAVNAENLNAIQTNVENAINSVDQVLTDLVADVGDLDTIIETGSNSNGNWIKFKNGTLIVTQIYSTTFNSWSAWGSMYSHDLNNPPVYPVTFVSAPAVSVTTSHSGSNFWMYERGQVSGNQLQSSPSVGCVRPNNPGSSNVTVTAYVIAIGKWK